jgi:hypothetical protein
MNILRVVGLNSEMLDFEKTCLKRPWRMKLALQ